MSKEEWEDFDKQHGHKTYKVKFNILKIKELIDKWKRRNQTPEYEYYYECCGKTFDNPYNVSPYCSEHFGRLLRRERAHKE